MNMIISFIALFLLLIVLRKTKSISNVAHVLSRVSSMIDLRGKKENETRNKIKLDLCFILGGMQQCNY